MKESNNQKTRSFLHARVYKNGCVTFQHPPGLATRARHTKQIKLTISMVPWVVIMTSCTKNQQAWF